MTEIMELTEKNFKAYNITIKKNAQEFKRRYT